MTDVPDDQPKIKQSRWVHGSGIPRYDQRTAQTLSDVYTESMGWRQGARVGKPK